MRTTVMGLIGVVVGWMGMLAFPLGKLWVWLFVVGLVCLTIVGPILWVRGARQARAEQMDLLRQIAAQGQPPAS